MKMCADEIQKEIKRLNTKANNIIAQEKNNWDSVIVDGTEPVESSYNFLSTQRYLMEIYERVAALKHILNEFNITTKIEYDNRECSIDEALVLLSTLNSRKCILEFMMNRPSVAQKVSGSTSYTIELNYDLEEVSDYYESLCNAIRKLQVGINKANLIYEIEVPD